MINPGNWLSNKNNLKIVIMAGLAILLIFVLKYRFFQGQEAGDQAASTQTHDSSLEYETRAANLESDPTIMEFDDLKPPPSLETDIFSSGNAEYNPGEEAKEMEVDKLELRATIIDDQGALAIIDDDVLRIGEFIKGLQVRTIKNNEVMLSRGEKNYTMSVIKE